MIVKKENGSFGEIILYLSGRLDNNTADVFREAVSSLPGETARLVLDFRDLLYISSAGLRELLICRRRFPEDRLVVRNVTIDVMEILQMTGFDSILPVEMMKADVSTYINLSFKELLHLQVREAGEKKVLMSTFGDYTWTDIDRASQIIAQDLSSMGVGPRSHVGICGANSVNWILTFFALQKLGALAMLINPGLTAEEIGKTCAIGDVSCLCCGEIRAMQGEETFRKKVQEASGSCVKHFYSIQNSKDLRSRFHEYWAIQEKFSSTVDADAPCVVIFTSGSTGVPKGVLLSSYNLLNAAAVQVKRQYMTEQDRELLTVPLFHILGLVVCLLPCAIKNVPLYIPEDTHSGTLIRIMKEAEITLMHSVPTLILAMMKNPQCTSGAFQSMRCTLLAGAPLTEAQIRRFRETMPGNHFINAYGLSEMAPVSMTLYEDSEEHLLHTVGCKVDNISLRIADRDTGRECSPGEAGEILVQGYNLMTGYYKLPLELQPLDEDGWLHTGDMGCLTEDGYLRLLGRYKELIIRGGENIIPMEVEAAVSALPAVDSAKVIGIPSDFYGEEAAACIILKPGSVWNEDEAAGELSHVLARYKIPSRFFLYDRFPMLGSGKVDTVSLSKDVKKRLKKGS